MIAYTIPELRPMMDAYREFKKQYAESPSKLTRIKILIACASMEIPTANPFAIIVDEKYLDGIEACIREEGGQPVFNKGAIMIGEVAVAEQWWVEQELKNAFWDRYSVLIGSLLSEVPEDMHADCLMYMQEASSVYGSVYKKHTKKRPGMK